jgi:hypothetical protein
MAYSRHITKPRESISYNRYGSYLNQTNDTSAWFYIQDPTDRSNIISKGTFGMGAIQDAIRDGFVEVYITIDDAIMAHVMSELDSKKVPIKDMLKGVVTVDQDGEIYRELVCGLWDRPVEQEQRK